MAGEIQIGGTTFATESGGTVTVANVNSATNRTNLGLGSMATQNANAVALTGGSLTGTEIDLKSSGTTIYKSDGTTAVLSESGGVVTLNNGTIGSSVVFPANMVLNVWSSSKTDTASTTSTSFTSTGLSELSITVSNPKSESSKFLISFTVYVSQSTYRGQAFRIMRGATPIGVGDSDGSRTQATAFTGRDYGEGTYDQKSVTCLSNSFLDSPATTSSTTYSLQWGAITETDGTAITINRTFDDASDAKTSRTISTITVMEIQG